MSATKGRQMQREKKQASQRATLYLMVGYPGSGKTTTSQIIHDVTGAVHIWADYERRAMFGQPTHSKPESRELYDHLNKTAELLLADGQSVIFDTNFNFRKDRDLLRSIAEKYQADTRLIWIRVDDALALKRAQAERHASVNQYSYILPKRDFERMVRHLQPPAADEKPVILDGTKITRQYVVEELKLPRIRRKTVAKAISRSKS